MKELTTEADRMEAQVKAIREAARALTPPARRGRPKGSKNKVKVTA